MASSSISNATMQSNMDMDSELAARVKQYYGPLNMQNFGLIRAVLIDLSGTLHIRNTPTEDAVASLERLRNLGVKIRFVTNTTKESKRLIENRLRGIGFVIGDDEVFTSLRACSKLIQETNLRPYYMVDELAMEDFPEADPATSENPNAVVVGLSPESFDYDHLNTAFKHIMSGAMLIGIHEGRYFESGDGLALGPGPFVKALESASNTKAFIVGKPSRHIYISAMKSIECELDDPISVDETVMIGDDVRDDVLGAIQAGMKGILVKTGKYRTKDEDTIAPDRPTLVAPNFAYAVNCIEAAVTKHNMYSRKYPWFRARKN